MGLSLSVLTFSLLFLSFSMTTLPGDYIRIKSEKNNGSAYDMDYWATNNSNRSIDLVATAVRNSDRTIQTFTMTIPAGSRVFLCQNKRPATPPKKGVEFFYTSAQVDKRMTAYTPENNH